MNAATATQRANPWAIATLVAGAVVAAAASIVDLAQMLPLAQLGAAVFHPQPDSFTQIIAYETWLPRIVVALLCGAGLALAGTAMQQVLRNPLAEPLTLGTSAGAQLAIVAAATWVPAWALLGHEWIAFAGGALATALVFGLAWKQHLAPTPTVLAGMIVSLLCGALVTAFTVLNSEYLEGFFLWGSGSLMQHGWANVVELLPRVVVGAVLLLLAVRALEVLDAGDEAARSVGLSLRWTRFLALGIAVAVATTITAAVGIIGFVGLAAPALARLGGARRLRDRLLWAPIVGAVLLWLTDEIAKHIAFTANILPAGAVTALIGAPILLWMVPRLRFAYVEPGQQHDSTTARSTHPWRIVAIVAVFCAVVVVFTLFIGRTPTGWHAAGIHELALVWPWRFPRVAAALGVGVLLALSGCTLQRLTGNPMAGPDVLGISTGAALLVVALFYFAPEAGPGARILCAAIGAGLAVAAILWLGRRTGYAPERMLLAGVAFGALAGAALTVVGLTDLGSSIGALLDWLVGSLYDVTAREALNSDALAVVALAASFLLVRWLDILPLGAAPASSLGVNLSRARLILVLFAAVTAAAATVVVGPLGFVGLMAPHMARLSGMRRAAEQLAGAAVIGATTLVVADWVARNIIFPYQLPAGIVAAIVGAPYLLLVLWNPSLPFARALGRLREATA